MDKVSEYIRKNWKNTLHNPSELSGNIKINKPYMSPCIKDIFTDMFYWDTYFINLGLYKDGMVEQAENNLENIATFIDTIGFMPNSNNILDRSQPPFFTRGVYDLYKVTGEKRVINKFIETILREYDFWQKKRMTPIGLNAYGTHGNLQEVAMNYLGLCERVAEKSDTFEGQLQIALDIMAIAESGLDFNMRFRTPTCKISAHEFAHLDLNCLLYDAEIKTAEMLNVIGREKEAKTFLKNAKHRKKLINKYFYDKKTGIYWDYNFEHKYHSKVLTGASLCPHAFGVTTDSDSALKVLKRLELKCGMAVGENRGDDFYFQWDYPNMWPYTTHIAYTALLNVGCKTDAKRIAQKYVDTVQNQFEKTGQIWEKYDARDGGIGKSNEYETPPMIGWSAAVYRVFVEELKDL